MYLARLQSSLEYKICGAPPLPPDRIHFRTTIIHISRISSTQPPICIPRQVEVTMLCPSDELSSLAHQVSKVLFRTRESFFSLSLLRSVVSSTDVSICVECFVYASADSPLDNQGMFGQVLNMSSFKATVNPESISNTTTRGLLTA
jgi:hypothetical protein